MPAYVALPTDTSTTAPSLHARRLAEHRRILFFVAAVLFFVALTFHSPAREYTTDALAHLKSSAAKLRLPSTEGPGDNASSWRRTEEEEAVRNFRWQAEPDETLKRAVASLSKHDTRTRDWLRRTRPHAYTGTPIGYSSSSPTVEAVSEGPPAQKHSSLPRSWEGPGDFEGGSSEKYGALLKEWQTGRQSLHDELGKWQENYTRLHAEIMRGEREPGLLEYECADQRQCGGLADRMLGMTTTLLLSLLTDRAFVATWEYPIPLSLLFDSPNIDWSEPSYPSIPSYSPEEGGRPAHVIFSNETLVKERERVAVHNFKLPKMDELLSRMSTPGEGSLLDKPWVTLERPNRGIALHSFSNRALLPQLASLGLTPSTIYAQLVHYLFRPKLDVLLFINEYTSLFALPSVFGVGIQIRTGDVYMRDPKRDAVNTVERHQHFFDCANEVVETYAPPCARPLFFLITDSATLRRSAAIAYPDRVIISGLAQHHSELRDGKHRLVHVAGEEEKGEEEEGKMGEMRREWEGLQNTVAESWIFESMDFALLSQHSGFGKIPTFMHSKPNRAISVPRVSQDPDKPKDHTAFIRPAMPSCRLETTLASFSKLASGWSFG